MADFDIVLEGWLLAATFPSINFWNFPHSCKNCGLLLSRVKGKKDLAE